MTNLARAARAQKWPPRPRAEKSWHPDGICARILAKGPIFSADDDVDESLRTALNAVTSRHPRFDRRT